MEICNGRKGSAGLLKYQFLERRRPGMVTWRATWRLNLPPRLISSWEALALSIKAVVVTLQRSFWTLISSVMAMLYTIFNYQSRYFDLRHYNRFVWSIIIKRTPGLSR
ncbi:hypothetical protein F5Y14DRAFT_415708 [Nemania sp. NC0429]|nr:hypothetical protein F5Y14DRAFT_415708 [Nemania sp. NC0429]